MGLARLCLTFLIVASANAVHAGMRESEFDLSSSPLSISGFPDVTVSGAIWLALARQRSGCEGTELNGIGLPLVWPQAARLGDSVGWLLSTHSASYSAMPTPYSTWTSESATIGLTDEQGYEAPPIKPRMVFEMQNGMGAELRDTSDEKKVGGIIALFDLPAVWPNQSNPVPEALELTLYVNDQYVNLWWNTVEILGAESGG